LRGLNTPRGQSREKQRMHPQAASTPASHPSRSGLRPLTLPDEGRYAGVAYAMLQSGDLALPRLHGLPYFHKPPLTYWIDAAAMQAFGINAWSARASEQLAPLRWTVGAWAAAALAVLSKGLIGLVLPSLVLLPWLIAQRRWRGLLRLLHPAGWLLFLLLVLPWFIAMQQRFPGFFDYFVGPAKFIPHAPRMAADA
jgi:4-amino-4-deoxy-L-arabinose transferase-like glycosyltransferase